MPRTSRDVPPPLELACLKALWSLREARVRAVQELVAVSRPLVAAGNSVMAEKMLQAGLFRPKAN